MLAGVPFNASIYGYECKDEQDLYTVYSETDQGLRRSYSDIVRAGRNIMPKHVREMPHGLVSLFGAAILMASENGRKPVFNSRSVTAQSRVFAVCARPVEARFLFAFRNSSVMNRIAVRMAMVATHRVDPEQARIFWEGVAEPDDLFAGDPRRLLFLKLLGSRGILSAQAVREMYMRCIVHWNAYVTGHAVPSFNVNEDIEVRSPKAHIPVLAAVTNLPQPHAGPQTFTANPQSLTAPMSAAPVNA